MKFFLEKITLNKNARGCHILDTVKGCSICKIRPKGCYDNCYAKSIADRYKIYFTNIVKRDFDVNNEQLSLFDFKDTEHTSEIIKQIKRIKLPFVRIGEMGDPSENWEHTINVCKTISVAKKTIVIITKHWQTISDELLKEIEQIDICINTSISALDSETEIKYRLLQYNRLKKYCKSVLRVVTCDFNKHNEEGKRRADIQSILLKKEKVINTIFRPSTSNPLVENDIINIKRIKFLKKDVWASVNNENTYFGDCYNCPDMCGINL